MWNNLDSPIKVALLIFFRQNFGQISFFNFYSPLFSSCHIYIYIHWGYALNDTYYPMRVLCPTLNVHPIMLMPISALKVSPTDVSMNNGLWFKY
jgi:hypothetical protein